MSALHQGITAADFALSFDFIVESHGSVTVIDPTSQKALDWMYSHLPETCDRWGKLGFVIKTKFVADVLVGMRRDGLMSRQDFKDAMNERDAIATQWEN